MCHQQLLDNTQTIVEKPLNGGVLFKRIVDGIDVDISLIEKVMEYIDRFHSRRT